MIKALVKKQFAELFYGMFSRSAMGRGKKGKKGMISLYIVLLVYAVGASSFLFYSMSDMFFTAFIPVGLDWLCFSFMSISSLGLGIIGTVFLTNSMLYNARDNELLLAMPIKPRDIIYARLLTLYIMDAFFTSMIMLPCMAAYIVAGKASITFAAGSIGIALLLPLLSLAVSCLLGFIIALVSGRMKNKSLVTVVLSIAFIILYFYAVSYVNEYLAKIISNGTQIASDIKTFVYPVYAMGRACAGDMLSLFVFALISIALFAVVYVIVSASFIRLATMKRGTKRSTYREKAYKEHGTLMSLLKKELLHFWSSSVYMLNSAMGSLFILIASVFLVVKADYIKALIFSVPDDIADIAVIFAAVIVITLSSMNLITAPSISLEGKNMWLLRSMPIATMDIFQSKIYLHMLISGIPTVIFSVVCVALLPMDIASATIIPTLAVASNFMFAMIGLAINLKHPSFDWTNEVVPVKQGMSVFLTMLVGFALSATLIITVYLLFIEFELYLPASAFILGILLILLAVCAFLWSWLCRRGVKIFETL